MLELRFRLADGGEVNTTRPRELFDALWLAGDRRGAISLAGKVAHARAAPIEVGVMDLDQHESARLQEALERISRNGSPG